VQSELGWSLSNEEIDMNSTTLTWIIVAIVVLAAVMVAAVVVGRSRRQEHSHRERARELRETAQADQIGVQRREAEAAKVDAQARMAQAEADARAADAAQLQAQARDQARQASESRSEVDAQLRRADEIDPDQPGKGQVDANPASRRDRGNGKDGSEPAAWESPSAQPPRHEA